ncbi:MAG: AMP-binding protein, partial [Gammaproteobacteria bacterium]|nr:AMP-binding protein [Gammaproteobacteria bacterium]
MTDHDAPAPSAYDYPLLIRHLLHTPLVTARHQEIVHPDGGHYDYATFAERVSRLASGLAGLGVGRGSTVAVMSWDTHCYLECFFAIPMLGAVLHTVNIRLSPEQILYTINHAEDDVIIVHADFVALLEQIAPRIERPVGIVLMEDGITDASGALALDGEYEGLIASGNPAHAFEDFDERTRATTFYTTGTTGEPKGVYFSHRQIVLHTLGFLTHYCMANEHGRFTRDDVYMPITPMFHVHAWGVPFAATLMGLKQVYPGRYEPDKLLGLIEREQVTFSHCVPTILHMLLEAPAAAKTDLSRWKVVVGGSALPRGLARAARERGIDVFGGYGMSETCPVVTVAHLEDDMIDDDSNAELDRRLKSGRPLPMVDLRIVDEQMNDVPRDG